MRRRGEFYFIVFVAVISVLLFVLPTGYENPELTDGKLWEKAEVVSVDDSDLGSISVVTLGAQSLELEVLSGEFRGERVVCSNELLGDKRRDIVYSQGDCVSVVLLLGAESGGIVEARVEDFYRGDVELVLVLLFFGVLIVFAGRTGLKAALSFIFTALCFWKLLIPAFLSGYSPFGVSLCVVFVTTSVVVLLVGGFSRRGVVALCGATLGVLLTALMAWVFGYYFKIPGTVQEYSDALIYSGFEALDFSSMFLSCVFISSAGAVMDVAMDIAASQSELARQVPGISRRALIRSGFNVARPVVGSMTTTLLFAYSGMFMFTFMAFMAQGVPIESIVNRGFIASEILHTLVGSFGLVLVAPLTSLVGGFLMIND
ncbi:MAG: YibE/F family protein [Rikenellaceae bacterium]